MRKIIFILSVISILLFVSCDKTTESDNTPPTVVITYPANNSEFGAGTLIQIIADANDNKGIEKVEFYINGTKVSTDTTEPYEYDWDTGSNKNTIHTIYAKAYDTSNNSTTSDVVEVTITEATTTVTDIDGNVYQTIIIGDQEWMMENLKVTHYRNGDPISHVTDNSTWAGLSTGAYCVYNNTPSNADTYGALYNWYAVDDSRNIAPVGWHVPTDDEIKELEIYLGMTQAQANDTGYRGTNEGSKLAGNANLWNNGALENNSEFGSSGFTALPGGYRYYDYGSFNNVGDYAYFWTSTEHYGSGSACYRILSYDNSGVSRNYYDKKFGFSIRCLRSVE